MIKTAERQLKDWGDQKHSFTEREVTGMLQKHIQEIANRSPNAHNRVILVDGVHRCGKTVLLQQVIDTLIM